MYILVECITAIQDHPTSSISVLIEIVNAAFYLF